MNNTAVRNTVTVADAIKWPDLSKDEKALELAKTALGWSDIPLADRMARVEELVIRAQQIKAAI